VKKKKRENPDEGTTASRGPNGGCPRVKAATPDAKDVMEIAKNRQRGKKTNMVEEDVRGAGDRNKGCNKKKNRGPGTTKLAENGKTTQEMPGGDPSAHEGEKKKQGTILTPAKKNHREMWPTSLETAADLR